MSYGERWPIFCTGKLGIVLGSKCFFCSSFVLAVCGARGAIFPPF